MSSAPSNDAGDAAARERFASDAPAGREDAEIERLTRYFHDSLAEPVGGLGDVRLAPFLEVARSHRGAELGLEQVTRLVAAGLDAALGGGGRSGDPWGLLARPVAQVLWEDPLARERLVGFWRRMMQSLGAEDGA